MTEEIKASPAGSQLICQGKLKLIDGYPDLDAEIGFGGTGTKHEGMGLELIVPFKEGKPKEVKFPAGKFMGNAAKVPVNKQLWDALGNPDLKRGKDCTTTYIMSEKGYWELTNIQPGNVGTPGFTRADKDGNLIERKDGRSNNSYDNSGPIRGKLENWALELAIVRCGKKVTLEDVLEELNSFDAKTLYEIDKAGKRLYKSAYLKAEDTYSESEPVKEEEPVPSQDNDDDEDWDD